jgi:hypothetical protein
LPEFELVLSLNYDQNWLEVNRRFSLNRAEGCCKAQEMPEGASQNGGNNLGKT